MKTDRTESQPNLEGTEPLPFSDYFCDDRFLPEKVVSSLTEPRNFQYAERRLLVMGLMCWIVAPGHTDFIRLKILRTARVSLRNFERKNIKKVGDQRLVGVDLLIATHPKTKWLYSAFEALGGNRALASEPTAKQLYNSRRHHGRHAAFASDVMSAIHLHAGVLSKENRRYGKSSLRKALAVLDGLIKNGSPNLLGPQIVAGGKALTKVETIRSEVWPTLRATVAWCYASSAMMIDRKPLLLWFAERGRIPRQFLTRRNIVQLIGMARFVQGTVIPDLPKSSRDALPQFNFPVSLNSVPFRPRSFSDEDLELIRALSKDGRLA